jgi:hypothetical protein
MRRLVADSPGLALALFLGFQVPGAVSAQDAGIPRVESKMVSVGPSGATLTLELSSGKSVELALQDGRVRMGDEVLGSYTPGDPLETSWRELVVQTLPLEDEALLEALVDWSPPEELGGELADVAGRMDEFLAQSFDTAALRARAMEARIRAETLEGSIGEIRGLKGLALLSRIQALSGLSESLSQLGPRVQVVVDDHLEVQAGSELNASLLVVDGTLEVEGTIRGDVLVVDGEIELRPGSRITGSVSMVDSDLDNEGGDILGEVRQLERDQGDLESRIREELLRDIREEMDFNVTVATDRGIGGAFRRVFGGIGDLVGDLATILVLGLVGAAFFHFAGPNMEAVAETARTSPGRAAMVGLAGGVLALPVWIVGVLGLAITIIGIPALILWVPLFPAAVVLAALMGYLAVARNLGVWLERQRYPYTDWVRLTNPVTLVLGGLLVLASPFMAAHLLGMVGVLGILSLLLKIVGFGLATFVAAMGFGAVLLTRGGRRPEEWGTEMFTSAWRERRWGRSPDPEAEAFDAELARDDVATEEPDPDTGSDTASEEVSDEHEETDTGDQETGGEAEEER